MIKLLAVVFVVPIATGYGVYHRLSTAIFTMVNRSFDSTQNDNFGFIPDSPLYLILYIISNTRGSSSSMTVWQEGAIKMHLVKPEGVISRWPQSHTPFGLASSLLKESSVA